MQPIDAWEAYYRQLAADRSRGRRGHRPPGDGARHGSHRVARPRATAFREEAEAAASTCLVQPAWSRTPIPVAWSAVRSCGGRPPRSFRSRSSRPSRSRSAAPWAAVGSGKRTATWPAASFAAAAIRYLWGFGVHAPNELAFRLPDSAQAFRCGLGIDAAVGDSGCVVGKVYLNQASGTPLFQSQPLRGLAGRCFHGRDRPGRRQLGRSATGAGRRGRRRRPRAECRSAGHRRSCRLAGADPLARSRQVE